MPKTSRDTSIPDPFGPSTGTRVTARRREVIEAATGFDAAFTVEELAAETARRGSSIGLATVYRTVALLAESGWLERVGEREGAALYFRCGDDTHHHHVVCTACGRVETAGCTITPALDQARRAGYRVTGHELTVYGVCPACSEDGTAS